MRWYQRPVVAGIVVTLGITGVVWIARPRSSQQPTIPQRLDIVCTRNSPYEGDAVIEAERSSSITVSYSLRNQSASVLTELVAKPGCRCQLVESLPARLEPGAEAIISIQMSVPEAGSKDWSVPITCAEQPEPLAVLTGGVRAKVNPPEWTRRSSVIHASMIAGDAGASLGLWESVELRSQKPWLDSLSCSINGLSVSYKVSELAFDRSGVVKRQFQISGAGTMMSTGKHSGELTLHYSAESQRSDEKIPLIFEVNSPIAVVPPKVDFAQVKTVGGSERRVTIFDRRGGPAPRLEKYDTRLLSVDEEVSQNGRVRLLRIHPHDTSTEHRETEIEFLSNDGVSELLSVRLPMRSEF